LASLIALTVWFCFRILNWHLRWEAVAAAVLFTLSSPQIVQGLRLQQLAIVEGCLLAAGAWCITRNRLATAGAVLAVSTIKPQMALLPLCWFAIWAMGDWHKRWRLPTCFLASMAALVVAGEILLPGWPGYFLAGLAAYRRYALPTSLLRMAVGDVLGEILGGLIVLAILLFAWRNRKTSGDSQQFALVVAAFFMVDLLALPLFTPFNQILLILPAMLVLHSWEALPKLSQIVFIACISWPWVIAAALLFFPPHVNSPSQLPLLPSFLVPFAPLMIPLLLMTRRKAAESLPVGNLNLL
jgi:hypothetical protein